MCHIYFSPTCITNIIWKRRRCISLINKPDMRKCTENSCFTQFDLSDTMHSKNNVTFTCFSVHLTIVFSFLSYAVFDCYFWRSLLIWRVLYSSRIHFDILSLFPMAFCSHLNRNEAIWWILTKRFLIYNAKYSFSILE